MQAGSYYHRSAEPVEAEGGALHQPRLNVYANLRSAFHLRWPSARQAQGYGLSPRPQPKALYRLNRLVAVSTTPTIVSKVFAGMRLAI